MNKDILGYNRAQNKAWKPICALLAQEIQNSLPKAESKIWHGAPVWFLDGNPVAGYAVRKNYVQLLFWSGQSFKEPGLQKEGSFKAAQARYASKDEINIADLKRWLKKSQTIQWDYKNIVKHRGNLVKITAEKPAAKKPGFPNATSIKSQPIENYISQFPTEVQKILKDIHKMLRTLAPTADESISYGVPTFKLNKKPLIYFAAFKEHLSIYPASNQMIAAIPQLAKYRSGRGTIKFPIHKSIPLSLIKKIVKYRLTASPAMSKTLVPASVF